MTSLKQKKAALEREQFLARRMEGIGGSDVHHLFSLDPWGCIRKLAYEKLELPTEKQQNRAMIRGNKLEAVAAEFYQEETERKIRRMPHRIRKDKPFLMVHADREIHSQHCPFPDLGGPGILEIKVPGKWAWDKIQEEGLPEAYQLQLQHGLLVTGRQWGSFCLLWADGWQLKWWDVRKDPSICESIETQADDFWAALENENEGLLDRLPWLPAGDGRCKWCPHKEYCHDQHLAELKEAPQDPFLDESEEIQVLAEEYLVRSRMAKEAAELKSETGKKIMEYLGDKKQVNTPGSRIHFKPQERKVFDSKRLKEDRPGLFKQYEKISWSRPLRISEIKR